MKSVVVGGGGFLGRYIVEELLSRGDEVTIVGRHRYPDLEKPRVTQVRFDIAKGTGLEQAFTGAARVFHTAARVGMTGPWNEFFETNVKGTEKVIEACLHQSVPRLIFTSSPSVIFDGRDHQGVDESYPYPTRWLSPYPHSKKLAEERVLAANGEKLSTVSLRPHLIWGKGDPHLIPRVVEQARRGKLRRVGTGKNRVDIIHVVNAARAHIAAAERLEPGAACAGKSYFISQGEPVVLWEFIDEILRRTGLCPLRQTISFKAAYRLGASLEAAYRLFSPQGEPRMTRFLAQTLAKDHFYDIRAARRDLDYSPTVTTRQGLDELFRAIPVSPSSGATAPHPPSPGL